MKFILFAISVLLFTNCQSQHSGKSLTEELNEKVADKTYPKIDGIVVEQNNKIIIEEYFNGFKKDSLQDLRSSFKSITSLLAGIAIDKKLISLDDKLGRFFPELKHAGKRNISVQNLLEMRSGLNCEEFYDIGPECETEMSNSNDWIAFCLGVELIREPGVKWSYNSNEPMLVGEIITRASGMSVMEFARHHRSLNQA